jgi:Transposase and inactivated derivatives
MKPGTFTQLYIQLVFAPQNREALLITEYRPRIFSYMSRTITNLGHKSIIVDGMADHVHVFLGLNPKMSIFDLVRDVKRSSSLWINEQKWFRGTFAWQDGYGAFSYGRSQIDDVYKYINHQEEHHQKRSFREEYVELLKRFEVEFEDQYLFDFFQ